MRERRPSPKVGGPCRRLDASISKIFQPPDILAALLEEGEPSRRKIENRDQYKYPTSDCRRRASASRAYLKPALTRKNLTVLTEAVTTKVLIENHKAVGVTFDHGGASLTARVNGEVILSGGAYNSPQLLMLSGIGAREDLARLGIAVARHLPGVGDLRFRCAARGAYASATAKRFRIVSAAGPAASAALILSSAFVPRYRSHH